MKIHKIIAGALLITGLIACEKEYEEETLPGYEMSGQWYVQIYMGNPPQNLGYGYFEIVTSNTAAANGKELLIDDHENIWPFKVKVGANEGAQTFSGTGKNLYYEGDTAMVTISNGFVRTDATKSISGITVDSIYMEAEFTDDPGTTYIFAGHYRTGFEEDEP